MQKNKNTIIPLLSAHTSNIRLHNHIPLQKYHNAISWRLDRESDTDE